MVSVSGSRASPAGANPAPMCAWIACARASEELAPDS
jgi:hypothetical protein